MKPTFIHDSATVLQFIMRIRELGTMNDAVL